MVKVDSRVPRTRIPLRTELVAASLQVSALDGAPPIAELLAASEAQPGNDLEGQPEGD